MLELNELKMTESNKPLFGASDLNHDCDENSGDDDEKQLNAC